MKTIVKRLIRDEKGEVLILALILLVVGGLILTPLLGLMSTGLLAGQVYEKKMDEYYAADAGVEDAIWRIQSNNLTFDADNRSYPEPLTVNDMSVDVVIARENIGAGCNDTFRYQILSTATGTDGGNTTIEAYLSVSYLDFSALLDNALVSQDTITISPNSEVYGDIWLPDEEDLEVPPHWSHNGTVKDEDVMSITWPTADQLSSYYLDDVNPSNPYPDDSIDIKDTQTIGPCYREGSLTVDNTGEPATLVLEGTVYVRDDAKFAQAGSHDYTINLNGQTIFAEGSIDFPSNVVTISGSGCIIAVGNINFQPSITGDDFVLVMSITGEVQFHPNGTFTGCIAGDANVDLQPNSYIQWISPEGKGLDVPWGAGGADETPIVTGLSIISWQIK